MTSFPFPVRIPWPPPTPRVFIRRRIFVSYHHDGDQPFYDEFSRVFSDRYEIVYDNSIERIIDSDDSDYIMRRIREEHLSGSSCTIVLCGAKTPERKFVDWEIKATLDKQHGLIGVNLPTIPRTVAGKFVLPGRLHDNCVSGYVPWVEWRTLSTRPTDLRVLIEDANSRSKDLIDNTRPLKSRNG